MQNKKPITKMVIPVVVAGFLVLALFVALTYIFPQASAQQPHTMVIGLLFAVFAVAAGIVAVYESRLRFNVRPDAV